MLLVAVHSSGAQILARVVTPGAGRVPVADVVKAVRKLLAGHRGAIAPILIARSHLAQTVVCVNPTRPVGQRSIGPLISVVVAVVEAHRRSPRRRRGHRQEPVQVIPLLGRRHALIKASVCPEPYNDIRQAPHAGQEVRCLA